MPDYIAAAPTPAQKHLRELYAILKRRGFSSPVELSRCIRLQQARIYELNRDNRDSFHQRFQDHALRIMKKYGFSVVVLWESDTGEKL